MLVSRRTVPFNRTEHRMWKRKDERDKEVKDGGTTRKGQGSERMMNLRQEIFFLLPFGSQSSEKGYYS